MYLVVNNFSGIVHILGFSQTRGFVDLLGGPGGDYRAGIFGGVLVASLGAVTVSVASLMNLPPRREGTKAATYRLTAHEARISLFTAIVLIPASLPAVYFIQQYVATTEATRVISLDGGLARISFLAQWLTWGVGCLGLYLISRSDNSNPAKRAWILGAAVALTVASLNWTGGRSIVVVMTLPMIVAVLPTLGRLKKWTVTLFALGAVLYVASVTTRRLEGFRTKDSADINAFIDWQWGRFSIDGFAQQYVSEHGILYGETIFYGLYYVPYGMLKLIGLGDILPMPRSSMEIMGAEIFSDPSLTYLLPGFVAEYYMNFGIIGVVIALAGLAWVVGKLDTAIYMQTSILRRYALSYVATVSIFCTVPAQSGSLPSYLLFTGLPVLFLLYVTRPRATTPSLEEKFDLDLKTSKVV